MNAPDTTVYDSTGRDRLRLSAWKVMMGEVWDYRDLTRRLVVRNFSAQFRQSFLSYLWVVLPPLATTVAFAMLRRANIVNVPMAGHTMPYALFVMVGTTVWGLFTQVCVSATTSISNAGTLVSKVYFPREVLVLSASGQAIIASLVRFGVVVLGFALFMYVPHWQTIFVPLVVLPLLPLALGLGMIFAPVNTMMNDLSRGLEFAFQFGLFLVPVVYPTPAYDPAATGWQAALYWAHTLNPVSYFIYATDSLIETGSMSLYPGYLVATVFSLLVFAVGWRFFHACEPLLAERL